MGVIRGGNYYKEIYDLSWDKAVTSSQALGGDLFSINNQSDQQFLVDNWGQKYDHIYIGNNDLDGDGRWTLRNGDEQKYSNWIPGQNRSGGVGVVVTRDWFHSWEGHWSTNKWAWGHKDTHLGRGIVKERIDHGTIAEIPLSYFSISDAEVEEGEKGKIKITRTGGTSTEQTLILATSDGSAVEGDDYKKKTKTITFAAGETSKKVNIVTNEDIDIESDETIKLTLSASSGDTVPAQIQNGSANLTIKNDEFKFGNSLYTVVNGSSWTEDQKEAEESREEK